MSGLNLDYRFANIYTRALLASLMFVILLQSPHSASEPEARVLMGLIGLTKADALAFYPTARKVRDAPELYAISNGVVLKVKGDIVDSIGVTNKDVPILGVHCGDPSDTVEMLLGPPRYIGVIPHNPDKSRAWIYPTLEISVVFNYNSEVVEIEICKYTPPGNHLRPKAFE